MGPRTLLDTLDALADSDPSLGLRFIDARLRETFVSYRELHSRVTHRAASLAEQGVQRGDSVLIALPTTVEAVTSFLALIRLGAVPHSVSAPLLGQDRDRHRARLERLVVDLAVRRAVRSRELGDLLEGGAPCTPLEVTELECDAIEAPAEVAHPGVGPDDLAFVQFSSGSTSQPKGVRITHRNLLTNMGLITANDRRTGDAVWVSWLPLYHDMGLVGGLLSNLVAPNALSLMDPLCFLARPVSWLAEVSRRRGTLTAVPNFCLKTCVDRIDGEALDRHEIDLSTFGYLYVGAEPVRPDVVRAFEERLAPWGLPRGSARPVYGMAETTLIVTAPDHDEPMVTRRVGETEIPSVGVALGDFEARIRDDEGLDLPPGEEGELLLRGTCVSAGYAGADGDALDDGWLATGDLAMLDEDGRIYITGRKKDLIIIQGRNVFGHDVAAELEDLDVIRRDRVAVIGVDGEEGEEIVVLAVPATNDLAAFEKAVRRRVLEGCGLGVRHVVPVSRIPKTTSGKLARAQCEEMYDEWLATAAAP